MKPWLVPFYTGEKERRKLKDVGRTVLPEEAFALIFSSPTWPYRRKLKLHEARDRCFLALLYLTAGRVGEVLSLRRKQFEFEPRFIVIRGMLTEKNKNSPRRDTYPLPRLGRMAPFTALVEEYLSMVVDDEAKLFNFSPSRALQITKHMTGKWNHYFRAQGERYLFSNVVRRNVFSLKKLINAVNTDVLADYVAEGWRDYEEELLKE